MVSTGKGHVSNGRNGEQGEQGEIGIPKLIVKFSSQSVGQIGEMSPRQPARTGLACRSVDKAPENQLQFEVSGAN